MALCDLGTRYLDMTSGQCVTDCPTNYYRGMFMAAQVCNGWLACVVLVEGMLVAALRCSVRRV